MAGRVRWLAGVVTVSFLIMAVSARFVVEKSSVRVLAPEHIRGHHDAAIGNFGVPDYGGTLTGVVLYPDKKATGCVEFDTKFKSKSRRPVILLLDRGECYFALKSWNAQRAGAAAVLIADNVDEQLLTMDSPEASPGTEYLDKINIPSALVNHAFGESLKKMMAQKEEVVVKLDWRESMPHPDERVEYELWTNSNDECGARCDEQVAFVRGFRGHAQLLERGGYARFTPHYITWYCPEAFRLTQQCKSQCINHGRYCAPAAVSEISTARFICPSFPFPNQAASESQSHSRAAHSLLFAPDSERISLDRCDERGGRSSEQSNLASGIGSRIGARFYPIFARK